MRLIWVLLIALAGCSGETWVAESPACWGRAAEGVEACQEAHRASLRALGGTSIVAGSSCGAVVDCANVPPPKTASRERGTASVSPTPPPARRASNEPVAAQMPPPSPEPATEVVSSAQEAEAAPEAPPQAAPAPPPEAKAEPVAVVASGAAACEGLEVTALATKGSLSTGELGCLVAVAKAGSGYADPDVQTAAVTLYNTKSAGWTGAVESALKRPGLRNAPRLNFAGIKPAYDGGQFQAVVARAKAAYRGHTNGFSLSGKERSYVFEFACRASAQLVLAGKSAPPDGLTWCERWMELAAAAGQHTDEIDDLMMKLE